jgi:DNA primase
MKAWLNFRQIKEAVTMRAVLQHYEWKCLRQRGDRVEGRCPIHRGQGENAFHADLRNHGFHCFSCHAAGSVLDLVAKVERCSIRQAALHLQEWFDIERTAFCPAGATPTPDRQLSKEKVKEPVPLRFSLRPIDHGHWYLKQRGIHVDTAAHFGAGYYAGPGLMRGRVVIPIHNERSQLVAYAGRSIDGADPKYKLPAGFAKSKVLFNLHRALTQGQDTVIVVEGFFDCLKVHQAGQACVVALMGCSLSAEPEKHLIARFRKIVLMLDGDLAGQQATHMIANRLIDRSTIRVVSLITGQQPDRMSSEEIRRALSTAMRRDQAAPNTAMQEADNRV